jgi:hypothetical protein
MERLYILFWRCLLIITKPRYNPLRETKIHTLNQQRLRIIDPRFA